MDKQIIAQLESVINQNAELLQKIAAQALVIDELKELVEELTNAVRELNLPYGSGYDDAN
jgi:methyl-accepting chemotaxis protein